MGLNIEGEKVAELCDYHFHPDRSEKLLEAILADFSSVRFAVQPSDVKKLGSNEAVAYRIRGKLSTTIEASRSDALTANLNGLSSFLRTNTPVAVKFSFGADAKLNVTLTNDFLLVFSRETEDRIRVGVKRGKVSSLSLSA